MDHHSGRLSVACDTSPPRLAYIRYLFDPPRVAASREPRAGALSRTARAGRGPLRCTRGVRPSDDPCRRDPRGRSRQDAAPPWRSDDVGRRARGPTLIKLTMAASKRNLPCDTAVTGVVVL